MAAFSGTKYFAKIWILCKKVHAFCFNCLKYRMPPKLAFSGWHFFWLWYHFFLHWLSLSTFFPLTYLSFRSFSLWKAIIYGKMMIFLSTQGPSGSPQALQYFFFYWKPIQKAFFDNFRKSQEFFRTGYWLDFTRYSDFKFFGGSPPGLWELREIIIYISVPFHILPKGWSS